MFSWETQPADNLASLLPIRVLSSNFDLYPFWASHIDELSSSKSLGMEAEYQGPTKGFLQESSSSEYSRITRSNSTTNAENFLQFSVC